MLLFFDESFRKSLAYHQRTFGVLAGIAIPEKEYRRVAEDMYNLKLKHLGPEFAQNKEIKGKEILKNYVFRLEEKGIRSKNLDLARDILQYLSSKHLYTFGCVCFEKRLQGFRCNDVRALDMTFRYIFERIDMFMKIKYPNQLAKIIFDDREYGINQLNSTAITNFFQRSPRGLSMDSIIKTPFFAISQAQNIGLQLADFVTTVIGLRFCSHPYIQSYFSLLGKCFFFYRLESGVQVSSLKVIRGLVSE